MSRFYCNYLDLGWTPHTSLPLPHPARGVAPFRSSIAVLHASGVRFVLLHLHQGALLSEADKVLVDQVWPYFEAVSTQYVSS